MNNQEVNQLTTTIQTLDTVKANLEALCNLKQVEPVLQVGPGSILVSELVVLLKEHGLNTGLTRLFVWLRENGYVHRLACGQNLPTQKSLDMHIMEPCDRVYITPTGVLYFYTLLMHDKEQINAQEAEKKQMNAQRKSLARKAKREQYRVG